MRDNKSSLQYFMQKLWGSTSSLSASREMTERGVLAQQGNAYW